MVTEPTKDKLYIIIPAYNEGENLQTLIEQWYPIVVQTGPESRLVIIDDGSKDNTYEILEKNNRERNQMISIKKENEGHGATILYGYDYALNNKADFIFQTDSDGQTVPEEFWEFWYLRNDYDMIIGWRKKRQDGFSRVLVTKVLKIVIKISFGVFVPDANTPFRLLNANILEQYIHLIPEKFNLSNVILAVIYEKKNLKTKYVPITFKPRQGGTNSINIKNIIKIGAKSLKDFSAISKTLQRGC